jgi:hypothetical protein
LKWYCNKTVNDGKVTALVYGAGGEQMEKELAKRGIKRGERKRRIKEEKE